MPYTRIALSFIAGLIVGTGIMLPIALHAMQGYVRDHRAFLFAEAEKGAASAHCEKDILAEIARRWWILEQGSDSALERYESAYPLTALSPFALAILAPAAKSMESAGGRSIVEAVSEAKLAQALEASGSTDRARALLTDVARGVNSTSEELVAIARAQRDAECE